MRNKLFKILEDFSSFILLIIIIYTNTLNAQTATAPSGNGTSGDPYLIATLDNLYWVTQNSSSWNKYFKQTADIDASSTNSWDSGHGFSPIGNNVSSTFSGTYDGDGYTINGLYIKETRQDI